MKIIKDKQLIENDWTFIEDDESPIDGKVCVSLSRWLQNKAEITEKSAQIGVRLAPTDDVSQLGNDLSQINLIEVSFPAFTDGRGFSQTRLLRRQYDYSGEIRATGNFMADQAFYMSRVGINAFAMNSEDDLKTALTTLNDFSQAYQPSTN